MDGYDGRAENVELDRRQFTNYLRNLSKKVSGKNIFNIPWCGVVIRNCDKKGEFLDFKTVQDYRRNCQNFWTELKICVFRDSDGKQFVEYVCTECHIMKGIEFMDIQQNEVIMSAKRCHHSKACRRKLSEDVDDYFDITPNNIEACVIFANDDTEEITLRNDGLFLACYQNERKISILYTVTSRQIFPMCSQCHHDKCPCFRKYDEIKRPSDGEEGNGNVIEVLEDPLPWDKISTSIPSAHYDAPIPLDEYYNEYGANLEEIKYPISRDKEMQKTLRRRMSSGICDLPKEIVAKYDGMLKCKHSNKFDPEKKEIISQNIIIHTEMKEQLFDIEVYGLQTEYVHGKRSCRCVLKPDCNSLLLWHLGGGEMVDYLTLIGYLQHFCHRGMPIDTFWNSREATFKSLGLKSSSLKKENWNKAVRGFVSRLRYSKDTWLCPRCTDTPPHLVADGKFLGPAKRKVDHLRELNHHEEDEELLTRASQFSDRVFLPVYSDRQKVACLLSGAISIEDFLNNGLESENGRLIVNIINRIFNEDGYQEIPKEYKRFLKSVCKGTPVSGLLQVHSNLPLIILRGFCVGEIDLRSIDNQKWLNIVEVEMPPFWEILKDILGIEERGYLPVDVADVVEEMIKIRENTFSNALGRENIEYKQWEDPSVEHPTMYYPGLPMKQYPKRYIVAGESDPDFCNKTIPHHRDFCHGIFSVGCACQYDITYGFEIMLQHESTHNFFRFLMCRDIKLSGNNRLKGIFYDNGCNFYEYMMNREPKKFQYLRVLIDGAHWNGQKSLKKPDRTGSGGHLGCSEGFNFNLYKKTFPKNINSQGREQLHSKLEPLKASLTQMNYRNFFYFIRLFLAQTNIEQMERQKL